MSMGTGYIVFVKTFKDKPNMGRSNTYIGHAICVLLGHCPPGNPGPTTLELNQLLGQAGLISLHDVKEMLGVATFHSLMVEFQKKYTLFKEGEDEKVTQKKRSKKTGATDSAKEKKGADSNG